MEAITTQELAGPKTPASKNGGTALRRKGATPLEERNDLTISEVEALGITEPYELIDGRIIFKMANPIHAYYQTEISFQIRLYLEQNPLGRLYTDLNLRPFPNNERQLRRPDLALYLNENRPKTDEPQTKAPDLAIEIVSESSQLLNILEKTDLYLEKGSKVVWIVIPAKACVWIWTASGRRWEYETLTCPELLPDFSLDIKKLFANITEFETAN